MTQFLFFTLGIFFTQIILPILDGVSGLFLTYLEAKKGKYTLSISKINQKITALETEEKTNAIGFVIPDYEEEEDDFE